MGETLWQQEFYLPVAMLLLSWLLYFVWFLLCQDTAAQGSQQHPVATSNLGGFEVISFTQSLEGRLLASFRGWISSKSTAVVSL